jgi:hypothetical protein
METEEGLPEIRWRRERREAIKPGEDYRGRRQLHCFSPLTFIRHGIQVGMPLDKIPPDYWALDVDDDGFSVAAVSCPCGQTPTVDTGGLFTCECDRCYVFTSEDVYVLNSPKGRQADLSPEASASA